MIILTNIELMEHWIETSDEDYEAMASLYKDKKYNWCLFIGHLVVEKLVKALYAKHNSENPYAPQIHDLLKIIRKCDVNIDDTKLDKLSVINTFNIGARYDDYKKEFYNKCTKEYTDEQIKNIEELRTWLKTQLV